MHKFAACIVATQDEFCLEECLIELQFQGLAKALIVSPQTYWTTGEAQSPQDLATLQSIAHRTETELVSVNLQAETPLKTEALYRNYGLERLSEQGFRHVVILDADEFWSSTGLEELSKRVLSNDIAYQAPFVPVIGVPGYPVAATSPGLVYVPASYRFAWGRATPSVHACVQEPVYHFSATRKTLDEVVQKSRRSAHYTEPEYAFERWIREVLPGVKPGDRDVHMYTRGANIWPLVRNWTQDELYRIPESLHPYLGLPRQHQPAVEADRR